MDSSSGERVVSICVLKNLSYHIAAFPAAPPVKHIHNLVQSPGHDILTLQVAAAGLHALQQFIVTGKVVVDVLLDEHKRVTLVTFLWELMRLFERSRVHVLEETPSLHSLHPTRLRAHRMWQVQSTCKALLGQILAV